MNVPRSIFRIGWAAHRILWRLSGHRLGTARPGKGVGALFLVSTGWRTRKHPAQRPVLSRGRLVVILEPRG